MSTLTKQELQLLVAQAISAKFSKTDSPVSAEQILKEISDDPACGQEYLENIKPVQTESGEMYKDVQYDTVIIQIEEKFISWIEVSFGDYSGASLSDIRHYAFDTLVEVIPHTFTETKYKPVS